MTECVCCYSELNNSNVVYALNDEGTKQTYNYCYECLSYIKSNKINKYIQDLINTDSVDTIKGMLEKGIPYKLDTDDASNIREFIYNNKYFSNDLFDEHELENVNIVNNNLYNIISILQDIDINDLRSKLQSIFDTL